MTSAAALARRPARRSHRPGRLSPPLRVARRPTRRSHRPDRLSPFSRFFPARRRARSVPDASLPLSASPAAPPATPTVQTASLLSPASSPRAAAPAPSRTPRPHFLACFAPPAYRALLPLAAGLPSPKKRREKREKRREGEEKRRGWLTCGPHVFFLIFFAD
uniref:Uncharacterized protein n=1 Tax=Oryza sativa subsp. japonica TaxID=39947 RepID=Q6H4W5_ORYSJ|nr:hypothetical protein [Oryza sativa Japonica Group]BAD26234.1 hypothetical protein [Oryza sativa Japonica Group]